MIEPAFVVKICGVTRHEDARAAVDAGANAVGFNFYARSPRYIRPEQAREIAGWLPAWCVRVGVFVNTASEELDAIAEFANLKVVQLHGEHCGKPSHVPRVWKSVPGNTAAPVVESDIEAYLLDTPTPKFGGSGETFEWSAARSFPHRMIVAGGLDATNVADVITMLRPWGVDACSRLESSPGRKDPKKIRDFVAAARAASETLLNQAVML
jgi:phosphoribosylanthranilate isomerase